MSLPPGLDAFMERCRVSTSRIMDNRDHCAGCVILFECHAAETAKQATPAPAKTCLGCGTECKDPYQSYAGGECKNFTPKKGSR